MDPLLLQKQLKQNSNDLQDFYKELKDWGEAMKRKDESLMKSPPAPVTDQKSKTAPQSKKIKTVKKPPKKDNGGQKTSVTDYSAWEKFDADAECEKVDYNEDDDSELTDECDDTVRDQAFTEKEKGNKFVKQKKWNEAIQCYTKAIDYYTLDPVFYANRALCFLKINNMIKAESDCNMSLKLDNKYVKAYQRRAVAREALNKLQEAENDLLKVLELEPNNKESQKALDNLRTKLQQNKSEQTERPLSKFAASRIQKKSQNLTQSTDNKTNQNKIIDNDKPTTQWSNNLDDIVLVKTINKPPRLRSKAPLKRIEIKEIDSLNETKTKIEKIEEKDKNNTKRPVAFEDKIIERHESNPPINTIKHNDKLVNDTEMVAPKSSVQFYSTWKHLKTIELKYNYLKLIKPNEIPIIFKESLDSDLISDILNVLIDYFIKNNDKVYEFLFYLTQVKRFSTFTIFMTPIDKKNVWKLIDYIKENEGKEREAIDQLIKAFEL